MAEELRWVLIVISVFVIGGLLVHGLWSVRKKESPETLTSERVEPTESSSATTTTQEAEATVSEQRAEPGFGDLHEDLSFSAQEQTDDAIAAQDTEVEAVSEDVEDSEPEQQQAAPSDFIIVHIQMPEGLAMEGSKLLPAVNMLGFKYSDEGFFNRHLDPAGNGPVLFRLVNMFNPGTFDIDNMEQFSTAGVSLFMTLPCDGDGLAAFNMLHSAAKKLADEFGATILDSSREEMTVESVREYVEKVRSFSA